MRSDPENRPCRPPDPQDCLCQIGPVPDRLLDDSALEEMILAPIFEPFLRDRREREPE